MTFQLEAARGETTVRLCGSVGLPPGSKQRARVTEMRRYHGFVLPVPDWESIDDESLILTCTTDDVVVGACRAARRSAGEGGWCNSFPVEMRKSLPGDESGFAFLERLVVEPQARSSDLGKILLFAAILWSSQLWPIRSHAAIFRPEMVRLGGWYGARELAQPALLPVSDQLAVLVGGRLDEAETIARASLLDRGWTLRSPTQPS
ncbi:hypothetical protein [Streptomyces sp. KS 21]|uniref:hypothetical protein n=1 Tax=Streptomyces sp. KS 21 TaxID=2485150 RepID=UPI0010636E18|nr:hypothetical protein [Streptomyces sp. KS 21]TDU73568.1 hypothetical protein EDD91_0130 [Streptomyces sp. KS 21]